MGAEHVRLVAAIEKLTGVRLEDDKLYLLESRLGELMKSRGLADAPLLAVGDGALGFWAALEEDFPSTRRQPCRVRAYLDTVTRDGRTGL